MESSVTLSHCHWHCLIDIVYVAINARVNSDPAVACANVLFACFPFNIGVVVYMCLPCWEPIEQDDVVQRIRWKMSTPRGQ